MKTLPKHIVDKVYLHSKYAKRANALRIEIEEWFDKQGLKTIKETYKGQLRSIDAIDEDTPITDILIDNETHADTEQTVSLLTIELNNISKEI